MSIKSVLDPDMPFASESRKQQLEPELSPAYQAWKTTPTLQTRAALVKEVSPVIDQAMTSYGMGSATSPVLRSRAKIMASQAFDTYDPAKGSLKTHLLSQLRGLQRHAAQSQNIIGIPERVAIQRQQLSETENVLRDELGRDPSDLEIADRTGLSRKRLAYIRGYQPPTAEGSVMQEDDAGNVGMPSAQAVQPEVAYLDYVYYDLAPVDQVILDYSLGLHGAPKLTPKEVAQRLGVTVSAISQRAAKIQRMLDEQHDLIGG